MSYLAEEEGEGEERPPLLSIPPFPLAPPAVGWMGDMT